MAESQNIEYKKVWKDEYLKWICGFAQIAPYFTNGCIPSNIGKDNLWFL